MKLIFSVALIVVCGVFWAGCDIVNPKESVPTYIHIDSFSFISVPGTGTSSHKINSVWVYIGAQTVGAFDLPATIPVIMDKNEVITMKPGVAYAGLKSILTPYPFYSADTATVVPDPGHVVNMQPKTGYFADTSFNMHEEDFETGNSFIKYDGDTTVIRTNDPQYRFEGAYSGFMYLTAPGQFGESISNYAFTTGGSPFLELDYKCSIQFGVGLQTIKDGQSVTQYLLTLRPKSTWNKVYIGLQDFVAIYPNLTYRIMIKAITDTASSGYIAIDNLKVISSK